MTVREHEECCWHVADIVLSEKSPTEVKKVCCHCGETRNETLERPEVPEQVEHGRFAPNKSREK